MSDPTTAHGVPLDVDALLDWLAERTDITGPLAAEQLAGGRSNLTYRIVDSEGRRFVVRRPPLGDLLPGAHDLSRESRVMAALAPTDVPVPEVIGHEPDPGVLGAEFYVMRHVDGLVLRTEEDGHRIARTDRPRATASLAGTLARLHAVDPEAVGLGERRRGEDYLARQLHVWNRQLEAIAAHGGRREPTLAAVHGRLVATIPPQPGVSIAHGDYRFDNCLVRPDGTVAAVLDWELYTLGDPLADLAIALTYWAEEGDDAIGLVGRPTVVEGYGTRDDLLAAYEAAGGTPMPPELRPWYLAFGTWRLAAILEGVYHRNLAGAYGEGDDSWRQFEHAVPQLAATAAVHCDRAGV
jgi:aminoglycoside phosphotransferase (APT) family kinase protein